MRYTRLEHEFVEYIPETLEAGTLYVSMAFSTVAHKCCCGCGREVVTPLTPTDWKLVFDGETVSIRPSIGNWDFPCRSHYLIDRGRVVEARPWTDAQVAAERRRDHRAKASFFGEEDVAEKPEPVSRESRKATGRVWVSIKRWLDQR